MKKISLKKAGAFGALSMALLGVFSASAMGFHGMNTMTADEIATKQNAMFIDQASLIGATVDEVKNAWADGKSLVDLAKEKGLTEEQLQTKMKAQRDAQMKTQLATLVSKGIITQAQADKRIAFMQTQSSKTGKWGKHGMGGGMGMMGF